MLQLKRFFKTVIKYKTSTYLTLLSLIVSFLGIIILSLYVSFEKSFDKFNKNGNNIYRIETLQYGSALPAVMSKLVIDKIPEVENIVTLRSWNFEVASEKQKESNINFSADSYFADSSFFNIFSFPLISGDKNTALVEPNSVVISKMLAQKIFGTYDALGQTLIIMNQPFKITGIMENLPKNSSIKGDCLVSLSTLRKNNGFAVNEWSEWSFTLFVQLRQGVNGADVGKK
ncbi:MAG: ABC transporter permease, partial [Bacteroidales bacterium]